MHERCCHGDSAALIACLHYRRVYAGASVREGGEVGEYEAVVREVCAEDVEELH